MDGSTPQAGRAHEDPWSLPLAGLDPSQAGLFETGAQHEMFRRLRQEDPVHYTPESPFGPYWSITRFHDIVAVDTDHETFSSNRDIVIGDQAEGFAPPMFIAMDPPKHDVQRKTASPAVAPARLQDLERADPPAGGRDPGRPAARRDLQLGRPGIDRADHPDAGDPVRLPVGGPPPAALLVGRDHGDRGGGRGRRHGRARAGAARMPGLFHPAVARARGPAAAVRLHLAAGPRPETRRTWSTIPWSFWAT